MRSVRAVDGITRAGERRRTERQHVHAFAAIGKTGAVARDHLEPREQVMAEGDRLRDLQVREAGHDGVGLALGKVEQRGLQTLQIGVERIDLIAQKEAQVGRDLVVARTDSMQILEDDTESVGGLGKAAAPEFAGVVFAHSCLPSAMCWIQRGGQYSMSGCATGRRRDGCVMGVTKSSYILAMLKWGPYQNKRIFHHA